MNLTADLTLAARRAEAKQACAATLARFDLPPADRKAVLLDLAMDAGVAPATKPSTAQMTLPATNGSQRTAARGRPRKRTSGAGGSPQGRTETLLSTLAQHPGLSIREMSKAVYGDDTQLSRNKTRSLLNALKKRGRVKNPSTGVWEAAA